ncbi:MAG: tryptophan 7-halogenase [Phycisphaerales bacterium]|nr:MAG: tryptophan 7-halogenase [Phycisphaerales bacterium]
MNSYDCLVVGGGPGGCVAATILADAGYQVALIERAKFPRFHVGESMIPYNYFPLERAGMIEKMQASDFPKKYSVQFVGRSGKQSQPFYFSQHLDHPCAQTWQVTRDVFDTMILDNAREHGVTVFEQMSARELIEEDGKTVGVSCVDATEAPHTFKAKVTLDASGGKGFAMSKLAWRIIDKNLIKHAIWGYYRGAQRDPGRDEGATTITYLEGKNWLWYIPLRDDIVSVGVVGDQDYLFSDTNDLATVFDREVEKNAWVKERLAPGELEGEHYACVHRSYRSKYCAKDGLVLLGDALTFLDPVFSTGMYLALVSGELAADAVIEGLRAGDVSGKQFQTYGETICRRIEILRRLVYAFYAKDFSFKQLIMKYPDLKGAVTDCLVGNLDQDFTALHEALSEFLELPEPIKHGRAKI